MFVKIFFRGMVITLSSGCVVARYIRKMLELIKNFGCNNLCNNSFFFFFFFFKAFTWNLFVHIWTNFALINLTILFSHCFISSKLAR